MRNSRIRLTHFFLAVFSLFALWVFPAEAATIRINAPKIQLELEPGAAYTGEIIAENPTGEETKAKIYLEDWVYAPGGTGEKIFSPAGSTPLSAGKWIAFSPAEETIKPFGRSIIRYTVKVPPDAKGTHYAVLFLETILGAQTNEEGVNVLVAGRIGALFFIEIKGTTQRGGEIRSLELKPPQGNSPLEIMTDFENTGSVDMTLGGNFLVMDKVEKIVGRGQLNKIYLFPGRREKGVTQWIGRLPEGEYKILLTYDLGKGQSLVEERSFVVSG
ncbi:MAG: hypothetical protein HY593_06215 [Candidatus Omnitrophica bacterium]|nr:hypothetical protein [Candidatus Omnitrophota bacterium]